jgi:ribosomal protein S18 acetylase RimI-like enzyme
VIPTAQALDREAAERLLHEIIALDARVLEAMGDAYSDVGWGREEFMLDLPGKWRLSAWALAEDGRLAGFWIASRKPGGVAHAHRVAVAAEARRRGIGRALFECARSLAARGRARSMALSVSALNPGAAAFYERLGFRRSAGDELPAVLGGEDGDGVLGPDVHEIRSGHRNHVYVLHEF